MRSLASPLEQVAAGAAAAASPPFSSRFGGVINWFPGHMHQTSLHLRGLLQKCDVVLEVRDARVPFSGGSPVLEALYAEMAVAARRVVVLAKADLASAQLQERVRRALRASGAEGVFVNSRSGLNVGRLLAAVDAVAPRGAARLHGAGSPGMTAIVAGLPNAGKSSLINALKQHSHDTESRSPRVGADPGITRSLQVFRVRRTPALYVTDTPGVLAPRIDDAETAMKLAAVCAIKETAVPPLAVVEFLLYFFARTGGGASQWVVGAGLDRAYGPEEAEDVAEAIARRHSLRRHGGGYDTDAAALLFLRWFRAGQLGRFTLDAVPP